VIKPKTFGLAGRVAHMWDEGIWWRNLRERDYLEDPVVERRIILR